MKERLLGFIFNTLVQDKAVQDRLRRFPTAMQDRHLANEIDPASVEALLTSCERRYPLVARYYRLKAQLLGLPVLEDYDRYAPLSGEMPTCDWATAQRIVQEGYAAFSPRAGNIIHHFFERRWIDAELRDGKRGGAFSASVVPMER